VVVQIYNICSQLKVLFHIIFYILVLIWIRTRVGANVIISCMDL
jgi:hypothetical protein